MEYITIKDFLTEKEIIHASQLWHGCAASGETFANRIKNQIILPNIERINKQLGQENDPMYLAYVVEYAVGAVLHVQAV